LVSPQGFGLVTRTQWVNPKIGSMELPAAARLALLYAHLLLCVFALHLVLSTDWRVLRKRISAARLLWVHRRVKLLLAGLWLSGLAIVFIDLGPTLADITGRPKLLAKLLCVSTLTLNALALRWYCFPRLLAERALPPREAGLLMTFGAISTTSWLAAAFFGVARPLAQWSAAGTIGLYLGLLALAIPVALLLGGRLQQRRPRRGTTALEEAAETLDLKTR
jgi:hypothetical protein